MIRPWKGSSSGLVASTNETMNWKHFLKAMLTVNLLWLVYEFMLIFRTNCH
jgi:K+-transporting ATPase A subunit